MTTAQKYIAWGTGILLWVFGLSILLSYTAFGYLDLPTVRHMVWVLSLPLALAAVLLYVFRQRVDSEETRAVPHMKEAAAGGIR